MLEIRDLHVSYGKVRAVQGVSLEVGEGEIVTLIGVNGAGKSSTMHAVCGIEQPSGGQIRFLGQAITRMPPHRIMRRGIVQVPEGRLIFGGLTVAQNLMLGGHNVGARARTEVDIQRVLEFFPMLRDRLDEPGAALSGGQAQLLALARGLMARPKLLILDEPSLGLAPIAARDVFALIPRLRDAGMTILLVEQNVRQALAIADRGYVLESGRIILDGRAAALAEHELLVSAYLGLQRGG